MIWLLIALFVAFVFLLEKFLNRSKKSRKVTLYLRQFDDLDNGSQKWHSPKSSNIFAQELCDEYHVVSVPLDCAVMFYANEIEFLKKQEDLHAKLHTTIMKDDPVVLKYRFWKKALKVVLLKTPEWLSVNILGNVETSFGNGMWIAEFAMGEFWSDLLVFHWFEESEHGVITCSNFKQRYNVLIRIVLAPRGLLCLTVLWVLPIFMRIYYHPSIIFSLKTYLQLIVYLGAISLGITCNVAECFLFWILPFEHSKEYYTYVRNSFEKQIKKRNIDFKVNDEKEYTY